MKQLVMVLVAGVMALFLSACERPNKPEVKQEVNVQKENSAQPMPEQNNSEPASSNEAAPQGPSQE